MDPASQSCRPRARRKLSSSAPEGARNAAGLREGAIGSLASASRWKDSATAGSRACALSSGRLRSQTASTDAPVFHWYAPTPPALKCPGRFGSSKSVPRPSIACSALPAYSALSMTRWLTTSG
ncbi:hypothetical protein COSO111634_06370 [Corallococcus soli]